MWSSFSCLIYGSAFATLVLLLCSFPIQPVSAATPMCNITTGGRGGGWWGAYTTGHRYLMPSGAVSQDYTVFSMQRRISVYKRDCNNTNLVYNEELSGRDGE